jgi:hypothetical protein
VRLIGIGVSKLNSFAEQEVLFEDETAKRKKLFRAVNQLRGKYDYKIIRMGV